ncbi:CBS domain-containing protein [Sphingomonas ginkgonis]|uniref:CBS domain-containing protein n=2 Tax=Sphingomonas ginkgonis TaxID=2315330 RepID=A0A429V6Q4_9SPHN|nr:CBS domain-containing protein [Sphingomonas ginkgonis]RST29597.1 CBS domain-containing protein [Sphingomonas ginkgonis]
MTIRKVLSGKGRDVATIPANAPLRDAVAELARRRIGALIVIDGGSVAGVISERDLVTCLHAQGESVLDSPVAEAMSSPAVTVDPDTEVLAALALITQRRIRHLPVIDQGQLAGIVSIGDLVKYRIDRIEAESEAMRAYIQGA